jgi:hypothetical protein
MPIQTKMIRLVHSFQKSARQERDRMFSDLLHPSPEDKILDLGGGDGSHMASIVSFRENVYLADISSTDLAKAKQTYGFHHTVLLNESGVLPFADGQFDIVFCSSVLEHATGPKSGMESFQSDRDFRGVALRHQSLLANEIQRVAKRFFVQTPYKYFLIESHTLLPVPFLFLPRRLQVKIIESTNNWWIKQTIPDFNLLTHRDMQAMFPGAEIHEEKLFGLTKSLIAVRC